MKHGVTYLPISNYRDILNISLFIGFVEYFLTLLPILSWSIHVKRLIG